MSFRVSAFIAILFLAHVSALPLEACTISSVADVAHVVSTCKTISVGSFTVSATNQPLVMNLLSGTTIKFNGKIVFGRSINYSGYLMEITGSQITVNGTSTNQLHGNGQLYWDGKGGAGSKKPTFLYIKGTGGSKINGLNIKNCPERCVAIDGSNDITFDGINIDNKDGAPHVAPAGYEGHNTDGFDISKSTLVTIKNSVVYNQDDCVAINQGSHITIENMRCDGSHGFDIATGMSKTDETQNRVSNVTFKNSVLNNGMFGLHILTCNDGGRGYVDQVTYQNITFNGPSDYGIFVQQDFSNQYQKSTGKPVGNVPITNVFYNQVSGTMNGQYSYALAIRCAMGACTNIKFNGVSIRNGKSKNECLNYRINGWC